MMLFHRFQITIITAAFTVKTWNNQFFAISLPVDILVVNVDNVNKVNDELQLTIQLKEV